MTVLDNKDILQVCATVIAGALVFLTLSSWLSQVEVHEKFYGILSAVFGLAVILWFSITARFAIIDSDRALSYLENGFVLLIFVVVTFIGLHILFVFGQSSTLTSPSESIMNITNESK